MHNLSFNYVFVHQKKFFLMIIKSRIKIVLIALTLLSQVHIGKTIITLNLSWINYLTTTLANVLHLKYEFLPRKWH